MFPKICCKKVSFLPPEITFFELISIILESSEKKFPCL